MSEWLKETDCKSVTVMLRWFESNSAQLKYIYIIKSIEFYRPAILFRTKYKNPINPITKRITKILSFGILNKLRNGVIIIRANPITLLIKNLG